MRRKDEIDPNRKKQSQKDQSSEYSIETQVSILLPYVKILPTSIQNNFLSAIKQMIDKELVHQAVKNWIEKGFKINLKDIPQQSPNLFLPDILCRFLRLNQLRDIFFRVDKILSLTSKYTQVGNKKQNGNSMFLPVLTGIQKQTSKISGLPSTINPNYENIVKMYKAFTDTHINYQYKIRELNENYTLFAPPRLFLKLMEMHDFQSNFPEKGNIIMMSFQGSIITGKRGFAFVSEKTIYWWQKNYKDIKEIVPDLVVEADGKERDKKNPQDSYKPDTQPIKLTQNFQLTYKMIGHSSKITSVSLSDDEYYLISSGADKVIKLWCLRQKTLLAEYRGHTKIVWSVSFSKSGYFFLSGSADKTVKLWSTDDSIPQKIYIGHSSDVLKVDFMKNPDMVVSSSQDKTVRIWNALTGDCLNVLRFENIVTNFKNSLSGKYFITSESNGKISIYDLLQGSLLSSFLIPEKQSNGGEQTKYLKIHDMSLSMDEKQFACVSSKYIIIYSFDKICEKQTKSLLSEPGREQKQKGVATKQVIYTGRESNLVFCEYLDKGVLLVATTLIKKY